jgi:hypothetical protein
MNWKLISYLSLYGLVMAFATVFWVPTRIEPIFWLIIFIACAWLIAKKCDEHFFWHGFLVSLANSVWITCIHFSLFDAYMQNHPEMAQMNASLPAILSPRVWMLVMGPFYGAAFGLILGFFSWIASKLVKQGKI